jgi:hypothetical protein
MDMNLRAYMRTDVPGSDRPLIETVEVINYLGDGSFSVRTTYGTITVKGERLTPAVTLDQYLTQQAV